MTEKRFKCTNISANGMTGLFWLGKDQISVYDVLKILNDLSEENEQLKQFQEQVASVIESKMGDNVCNDYKMEVLKEIWNELELDEVWFE